MDRTNINRSGNRTLSPSKCIASEYNLLTIFMVVSVLKVLQRWGLHTVMIRVSKEGSGVELQYAYMTFAYSESTVLFFVW